MKNKIRCNWIDRYNDPCRNYIINATDYCKYHQYVVDYTQQMIDKSKKCGTCLKFKYCGDLGTCVECRKIGDINRENARKIKILCIYCNKYKAQSNGYCGNHQIRLWKIEQEKDGKHKVCVNFIRGCRNLIDITIKFTRCSECLEKILKNTDPVKFYRKAFKTRPLENNLTDAEILNLTK